MKHKAELLNLIERIAEQYAPDEIDIVKVEGEALVDEAENPRSALPNKRSTEHFKFGAGDLVEGIKVVALILGTAKTAIEVIKALRQAKAMPESHHLQKIWKDRLIAEGIDSEAAEKIVNGFHKDLAVIAAKS